MANPLFRWCDISLTTQNNYQLSEDEIGPFLSQSHIFWISTTEGQSGVFFTKSFVCPKMVHLI